VPVYGWFTEGFDAANLKDAKGVTRCVRMTRKRSAAWFFD
jgi:hypothetical protein